MTKIIYKGFQTSFHGKGKKKRPSIVGVFYDQSRPEQKIKYTLTGINRAITQRELKRQETVGLEMGRDAITEEFKKLGFIPPISRKKKSSYKRFLVASLR